MEFLLYWHRSQVLLITTHQCWVVRWQILLMIKMQMLKNHISPRNMLRASNSKEIRSWWNFSKAHPIIQIEEKMNYSPALKCSTAFHKALLTTWEILKAHKQATWLEWMSKVEQCNTSEQLWSRIKMGRSLAPIASRKWARLHLNLEKLSWPMI